MATQARGRKEKMNLGTRLHQRRLKLYEISDCRSTGTVQRKLVSGLGMSRKLVQTRVVVIEFWRGFIDYNYLSLNRQLIPITISKVAYE